MKTRILVLFLACIWQGAGLSAKEDENVESILQQAYDLDTSHPEEAIEKAKQAYEIGKSINDAVICSRALSFYARITMFEGDHELGLRLYLNALNFCPPDSISILADIYSGIGWGYTELDDREKALDYIDKSLRIYQKQADTIGVAISYNYKGFIYYRGSQYDRADHFFHLALDIFRKQDNQRNIAAVINNLCMSPGNSDDKVKLIPEAISINQSLGNMWSIGENYNNLGKQYYYLHRYDDGLLALERAKEYAQRAKAKNLLLENYQLRSLIYAAQKDYPMAFNAAQKQIELDKEIRSEKNIRDMERYISNQELLKLKQEYELQQKKHDLAILQKNWIITVIVLLLCLLLFFMRFRWFKKKKEMELIARQYELEQSQCRIMELEIKKKEETIGSIDNELQAAKEKLGYMLLFLRSRNELLEKIRNMIRETYKMEPFEQLTHLKKVNTFIAQYQMEEQQDELALQIEEQNRDFSKRLEEQFPCITASEMNLAVLLRMNLSSKEIALITGNSVKTISMTRHRLRKHIGLKPEEDIVLFLQRI